MRNILVGLLLSCLCMSAWADDVKYCKQHYPNQDYQLLYVTSNFDEPKGVSSDDNVHCEYQGKNGSFSDYKIAYGKYTQAHGANLWRQVTSGHEFDCIPTDHNPSDCPYVIE